MIIAGIIIAGQLTIPDSRLRRSFQPRNLNTYSLLSIGTASTVGATTGALVGTTIFPIGGTLVGGIVGGIGGGFFGILSSALVSSEIVHYVRGSDPVEIEAVDVSHQRFLEFENLRVSRDYHKMIELTQDMLTPLDIVYYSEIKAVLDPEFSPLENYNKVTLISAETHADLFAVGEALFRLGKVDDAQLAYEKAEKAGSIVASLRLGQLHGRIPQDLNQDSKESMQQNDCIVNHDIRAQEEK